MCWHLNLVYSNYLDLIMQMKSQKLDYSQPGSQKIGSKTVKAHFLENQLLDSSKAIAIFFTFQIEIW